MLRNHWVTYDEENMRDLVDCLYSESEKERRNNNEKPAVEQKDLSKKHFKQPECNGDGPHLGQESSSNGYSHVPKENGSYYKRFSYPDTALNPLYIEDKKAEQELKKRITYNVGDIFGAGYDTLFSMVYWAFLYMAVYPDTQAKVIVVML